MIHKGSFEKKQQILDILADAFADDPVICWISKHPDYPRTSFEAIFDVLASSDEYYVDAHELGATLWLKPGDSMKSPMTLSVILNMLKFGIGGNFRSLKAMTAMEKHHPPAPAHYYLFAIGTRQKAQGRGLGSTLIQETLKKCDEEGVPAYLENTKERNLKFYQSHGFEVLEQFRFAADAPPVWGMWREPR